MLVDPSEIRRVLIVKLSSLGDVIHVTPCIRAIRLYFPDAEITMAVEERFAAIVRHNPHLDAVIEAPVRSGRWFPLVCAYAQLRLQFWAKPFDVAIDFQGNRKSAVWIYGSGSRVKAGRGEIRPGWRTVVHPDMNQHAIRVCIDIAGALGIPVTDPDPEILLTREDDEALDLILDKTDAPRHSFLVVNPFAAWPSKCWPLENYARLMEQVHQELRAPMIVTGGPGEEAQGAELMRLAAGGIAINLIGRLTLGQALCLYRRARLMVTGDSGPMHAAAALGARVVALFGPTLPELTGPWGEGHIVIQRMRPPSRHTYFTDPQRKYIRAIGEEEVSAAVAAAWESGGAKVCHS